MLKDLIKFVKNSDVLDYDRLHYYIETYVSYKHTDEEINRFLNELKDELENDLIYDEVEDSINGGKTSYYDKNKSKIELLNTFEYKKIKNEE